MLQIFYFICFADAEEKEAVGQDEAEAQLDLQVQVQVEQVISPEDQLDQALEDMGMGDVDSDYEFDYDSALDSDGE